MKAPRILLSLLFSSLLLQAHALIPTDRKQRLTEHWEFIRQDMGSIWEVMRPITGAGKPETVPLWQKVTLPHCFNAEDAVDPDVNYYQGPGWYRTMLNIENPYTNGRTCLEFEGAGQKTEVYGLYHPNRFARGWLRRVEGRHHRSRGSIPSHAALPGAFRRKDSYCHSLRQQPRHGAYSFRYVRLQPLRRTLPICQPRLYACRPF